MTRSLSLRKRWDGSDRPASGEPTIPVHIRGRRAPAGLYERNALDDTVVEHLLEVLGDGVVEWAVL